MRKTFEWNVLNNKGRFHNYKKNIFHPLKNEPVDMCRIMQINNDSSYFTRVHIEGFFVVCHRKPRKLLKLNRLQFLNAVYFSGCIVTKIQKSYSRL